MAADVRSIARRSPIVLTVFAVVTAALAATTTAFAALEKTVRLEVDGQQLTVRTFAGDVAGVLRKEHLVLTPHDTVAPDLTAPVHNGALVVVRHGRLVTLTLDGRTRRVWVTALSVGEALDQLGLRQRGEWMSASRSLTIPRQGLALELRIPQHVTVLADGVRHSRVTTAATVAELLRQVGVRLGRLDRTNVPLARYPLDGLVVTVARITQRTVTRDVAIPFRTRKVPTSALYVGQTKIVTYGRPGLRVQRFRLTWRNHKLARRVLVSSVLRSRPAVEVMQVGTKPRPVSALNWSALANCESHGNPRALSPGGTYRGLYQFTLSAWHGVGGAGDPIDASASEQTYRAELLYSRRGDGVWPVCGRYLYT